MFRHIGILLVVGTINVATASHDWVVHVPKGVEAADELALQHDFVNRGEALPGSNLYHFQQDLKRRRKRSTEELTNHFESHPDVSSFQAQDDNLVRVKRVPVRESRQNDKICFVTTVKTDTKESRRCVFPFTYKGVTYTKCTGDHSSNNREWCGTQVDANGIVIRNQWGDCRDEPTCFDQEEGTPDKSVLPSAPLFDAPRSNNFSPSLLPLESSQPGFPPVGPPPSRGFPNPLPPRQLPFNFQDFGGFNPNLLLSLSGLGGKPFKPTIEKKEVWPHVNMSSLKTPFNDEAWPSMWYLNRGGRGMDMNVEDAWAQGVSGKNVVVSILDDGVEWDHPDLADNYDEDASIDLNDNDKNPYPRYDILNSNKHGTRCAGTVAAMANNSKCAVGVAFDAKIGGVRILDGVILDVLEAKALSFNRNHIDIYSASWGPDDNGKTVDGPGPLAKLALEEGARKGRQGKGSIFVWASGNGGKYLDNCNCDGYTTSIYTLSVSSVSEQGKIPWYSEPCSSSLTTTYSSGSSKRLGEKKVVTTDLHGRCTKGHTGTSASSPMAAGIVALALEANPNLTWRDMQHIVVRTSIPKGHLQAKDWDTNAVGLQYSHSFGFGLMDAAAIVKLARDWVTVPDSANCTVRASQSRPVIIKQSTEETFQLDSSSCSDVKFIEHVHLNIDVTSSAKRGDLSVLLRSPGGTVSVLLAPRPLDDVRAGFGLFKKWPMMSVHFWGESVEQESSDEWVLLVRNDGDRPAIFQDWGLTFHGTSTDPQPGLSIRSATKADNDSSEEEKSEKFSILVSNS